MADDRRENLSTWWCCERMLLPCVLGIAHWCDTLHADPDGHLLLLSFATVALYLLRRNLGLASIAMYICQTHTIPTNTDHWLLAIWAALPAMVAAVLYVADMTIPVADVRSLARLMLVVMPMATVHASVHNATHQVSWPHRLFVAGHLPLFRQIGAPDGVASGTKTVGLLSALAFGYSAAWLVTWLRRAADGRKSRDAAVHTAALQRQLQEAELRLAAASVTLDEVRMTCNAALTNNKYLLLERQLLADCVESGVPQQQWTASVRALLEEMRREQCCESDSEEPPPSEAGERPARQTALNRSHRARRSPLPPRRRGDAVVLHGRRER